jgi:hypothetical protein
MTVYIALLAVAIGLVPVAMDKWRASHKPGLRVQPAQRRQPLP